MGQYFIIVNLDKKEYIKPSLLKLWEICANNDVRILGYLLATNNPDGTHLMRSFKMRPEEVREKYPDWEPVYYNEEYGYTIAKKKTKYFGRWCGDRIAVVGDYADEATNYDGPSYHHIEATFRDITEEAVKEFNEFIELDELKIKRPSYISPDMVVSADGISHNPKIKT